MTVMMPRLLPAAISAAACLAAVSLRAELPLFSIDRVDLLYPTLNPPIEVAARLTNDGAVVSGNANNGQIFAFTALGGAPRLEIPEIPGAVGNGDTGNGLIFNEVRQVVQSVYDNIFETNSTSHEPHLYTPGLGWASLGKPGGNNAIVTTINEVGQVLAAGLDGDNEEVFAWRYTPGLGWENLGNLGHVSGYARGSNMNDLGAVVGESALPDGSLAPFYYTMEEGMTAITNGGAAVFGEAAAVNNAGLVAGTGNGRAFLFDGATLEFTFLTEAITGWRARDINDAGSIIGSNGLGGVNFGVPNGSAFYWDDSLSAATSLDNLIGNAVDDWFITDALDINSDGWILGTAYRRDEGAFYQVLLRPIPEPSVALLVLVSAAFLGTRGRNRRAS